MAYPGSNLQVTPSGPLVENNELNFRNLYLHHTVLGPNANQSTVINANAATGLGTTTANNWAIYDGLGPYANVVVARARGLHIYAGDWHNSFTIVFEVQRFRGSTLQVMGLSVEEGEWAIVGGTGQFAMARGVIYKRIHEQRNDGNIIELTIHGFCPVVKRTHNMGQYQGPQTGPYQGPQTMGSYQGLQAGPYQGPQTMGPYQSPAYNSHPTKVGPWGGNGGTPCDITELPQRLESVTIRSGWVIDSLAFSYIDRAGQRRAAGPWGGGGGDNETIQLAPSEFVKEVSGTIGFHENNQVITSLKFVTNFRTYGPFGRATADPFRAPAPSNSGVVGFFGRSGENLDSIGVYTA